MDDFTNRVGAGAIPTDPEAGLDSRVLLSMSVAVAVAVVISAVFARWRVPAGFLLGGLLSLLNYRWMRGSISSAFRVATLGAKPEIGLTKYVLRYFVIGFAVYAAYRFGIVSLPAVIAGLCSFVVAIFVEAFREFYFAIVNREETN